MRHSILSAICLAGLFAAFAAGQGAKPNFSGTWKLDASRSQRKSGKLAILSVTIEQKDAAIHIAKRIKAVDGTETTVEYDCTIGGADCDAKVLGKASFFFDGPALIEMDASDEQISRTIMTLDDRQTICASVSYMFPKAPSDALYFEKQ